MQPLSHISAVQPLIMVIIIMHTSVLGGTMRNNGNGRNSDGGSNQETAEIDFIVHVRPLNCVAKLIESQPALSNWSAEHGGTDCCM